VVAELEHAAPLLRPLDHRDEDASRRSKLSSLLRLAQPSGTRSGCATANSGSIAGTSRSRLTRRRAVWWSMSAMLSTRRYTQLAAGPSP
jgi:hypothetical protein